MPLTITLELNEKGRWKVKGANKTNQRKVSTSPKKKKKTPGNPKKKKKTPGKPKKKKTRQPKTEP